MNRPGGRSGLPGPVLLICMHSCLISTTRHCDCGHAATRRDGKRRHQHAKISSYLPIELSITADAPVVPTEAGWDSSILRRIRLGWHGQQGLELPQVAKDGEVGILLYVLEVTPAGGNGFAKAGRRQVDVLLPL